MVVSGRVKSMNESVFYNVDDVHQAILADSQITFRYFEWDREKQRVYRKGVRTASPYALCWDDENYYMIAYTEEHGITHFRVDKMTGIKQTGTPRVQNEQTRSIDLAVARRKLSTLGVAIDELTDKQKAYLGTD